jgi:hypothetical protein
MRNVHTLFFALFFLALPSVTLATEIRLDTNKAHARINDEFIVDIIAHADEPINAIEGAIVFPFELLEIRAIRDGGSSVNFWIEKPNIQESSVVFSGITPGGFFGTNNRLFSIVFRARQQGIAALSVANFKAIKHDDAGTEVFLKFKNTAIEITAGNSGIQQETMKDSEPPEDFTPSIIGEPNIFDGRYVLLFATQDKGVGINRYEVREGKWGWFTQVESPYFLKHQKLNVDVYVKAVDYAGNERVVVVPASVHSPRLERYGLFAILIGFTFFVLKTLRIKKYVE